MKLYILLLTSAVYLSSCDVRRKDKIADDSVTSKDTTTAVTTQTDITTVQIIDSSYNFGKVTDGEQVEYNFRFKNSGTKPLVITSASASCGCTVPQKPDKPILPGETGFIKVIFDSKGRPGIAQKSITVLSNAQPPFPELLLTGEVISNK